MKRAPKIEELAGVHAGKITLDQMRKELDAMREHDMTERVVRALHKPDAE